MPDKIYFVVPLNSAGDNFSGYAGMLAEKYGSLTSDGVISGESRILFIDNCLSDEARNLLRSLHSAYPFINAVRFAHKVAPDTALTAGILEALNKNADAVIALKANEAGQINGADALLEAYRSGSENVPGTPGSGNFLLGKRAMQAFAMYGENDIDAEETVSLIGFTDSPSKAVKTNRSTPMLITAIAAVVSGCVLVAGLIGLIAEAVRGAAVTNSLLIISAGMLGCMVFASLWIVAGYLENSSKNILRRPRFIIDERMPEK